MNAFQVVRVRHRGPPVVKKATAKPASSPMTPAQLMAAISDIKELARRMRPPLNMNPQAFHEDKSDLVREIIKLEDAVRLGRQLDTGS